MLQCYMWQHRYVVAGPLLHFVHYKLVPTEHRVQSFVMNTLDVGSANYLDLEATKYQNSADN